MCLAMRVESYNIRIVSFTVMGRAGEAYEREQMHAGVCLDDSGITCGMSEE